MGDTMQEGRVKREPLSVFPHRPFQGACTKDTSRKGPLSLRESLPSADRQIPRKRPVKYLPVAKNAKLAQALARLTTTLFSLPSPPALGRGSSPSSGLSISSECAIPPLSIPPFLSHRSATLLFRAGVVVPCSTTAREKEAIQ